MTTSVRSRLRPRSPGQALALTMLLGALGAAAAFLATRQSWADVRTTPPRPLPASLVPITGSALVPYADALVVAGLASLAAVLATKGTWRRVSGLILAGLGAGLAASAFTASRAGAVAAAAATIGPASNPGAGSVTQGSTSASSVPDIIGAAPHVAMLATGWQIIVGAGALAMIIAGVLVLCNPSRFAVMSSKYEAPVADDRARTGRDQQPADSAAMWEALSRGDDPTTAGHGRGRA